MATMRTPINEVWHGTPNWHINETNAPVDDTTAPDLQRLAAGLDADLGTQLAALDAAHHRYPQRMSLSDFVTTWVRGPE